MLNSVAELCVGCGWGEGEGLYHLGYGSLLYKCVV